MQHRPGSRCALYGLHIWQCVALLLGVFVANTPSYAQPHHVDTTKSEGLAFAYSFLGTVVPVVVGGIIVGDRETATDARNILGGTLSLAGFLVGPSLGHVYSGNDDAIPLGAIIRVSGMAIMGAGVVVHESQPEYPGTEVDEALVAGGFFVLVAGVVTDWIRAPLMVKRHRVDARTGYPGRIGFRATPRGIALLIPVG